jgi:hypothetical protein
MYSLFWRDPSLPFLQKQVPISVPSGQVVSNAASLRFTGKGAANYGKILQENQMRLLESFAGPTPPDFPTVGQTWFDTTKNLLNVCISTAPLDEVWRSMNGAQVSEVGEGLLTPAVLGDQWFQRTGTLSGFQYVYTGMGRYPDMDWDASDYDYFPTTSTSLSAKLNFSSWTTQDPGEVYISGLVAGVPDEVDGSINVNGTMAVVPRGVLSTSHPVDNGFIVWDTTSTLTPAANFFSVRQVADGTFQYDNNSVWVPFTPVTGMYVIGQLTVDGLDDNLTQEVSSVTLWADTRDLTSISSVPLTSTGGAIGGWDQTYPEKTVVAGREEYDYMLGLLSRLIGSYAGSGGAGALGRSINYLTDFNTLDASARHKYMTTTPLDTNVLGSADLLGLLKVEPNSQDWDKLLAAVKYAVNRLELPIGTVNDVSDIPFVMDGRKAPGVLLAKSPSDVQYPSARRRANAKVGSFAIGRLYQETLNVLTSAVQNRYMLKGIQGSSGVNTSFNSTVATHVRQAFTADASGSAFASPVSHGLQFNFGTTDANLQRFFAAGQAIELLVQAQPSMSPTPADTELGSVTSQYGRFRITNDAVYIMTNAVTPALSLAPGAIGVSSFTTTSQVLATATVGGATLTLRGHLVAGISSGDLPSLRLYVDIVSGGATTGSVTVTWNVITDDELYNVSYRVFPDCLDYVSADKLGNTAGMSLFV